MTKEVARFKPVSGEFGYKIHLPVAGSVEIHGVYETDNQKDIENLRANHFIEEITEPPKPKTKAKAEK